MPEGRTDIQDLLRTFVDDGVLTEGLYTITVALARSHLSGSPAAETANADEDARDYAGDFLIHLKQQNKRDLQTKSALKRELRQYITQARNPESRELWSVLSEAIRGLAKDGRARRVDGKENANNGNGVVWTSAPPSEDQTILDLRAFREGADCIGSYYPQREGGRVIPPAEAGKLLSALLEAAGGPVEFSLLFEEAKRHVVLQMQHKKELDAGNPDGEADDSGTLDLADQWAEQQDWIVEEALHRAERIWDLLVRLQVNEAFCLYSIPREFLERKITLAKVAEAVNSSVQRVSEAHLEALEVLRDHLALDRLEEDNQLAASDPERGLDPFREALKGLMGAVAEILMKKCSESGLGGNFE